MAGSFTWSANVRVGTLKPYAKALVITVVHDIERFDSEKGASTSAIWNTIVCFRKTLREEIEGTLAPGDLVHFQGNVRTTTFTDDADATRRAVDLVATGYDILHKHIDELPSAI
ncbi:single-stranded DNA-binding protein [Labrenzia sp. DG1229]|uniref:single-stranded DNA-binding protein n=1 Tax=Labrenzia sp. DG1229 TaxID=681847 RepID=UPI00048EFA35|nr:single-stranded DNA-binding protein [Labrenzia sp. DG1229]